MSAGEPPNRELNISMAPPVINFVKTSRTATTRVLDASSARILNVRSGEELSGIVHGRQPTAYLQRSWPSDRRSNSAPPATVNLAIVTPSEKTIQSRATYSASTGAFLFRDVPEGRYTAVPVRSCRQFSPAAKSLRRPRNPRDSVH
jgi:hypothetical protein